VGTPKAVSSSPVLRPAWLPGLGGMTRLQKLRGDSVLKEVIFLCSKTDAKKVLGLRMLTCLVENDKSQVFTSIIRHLSALDSSVSTLSKAAPGDQYSTKKDIDINFDLLAVQKM
jgi:enoyl-CoA hydratase/carnithine racemase